MPRRAGGDDAAHGQAERLRRALEAFAAGDPAPLDALRAPDFLHIGHPLLRRDGEAPGFASMSERLDSFAERGISATARLIDLERVADATFVATMMLHTHAEAREGEGMSMLAGVVVIFDGDGGITHVHTYDTPAAARTAAGAGCCDAHRRRPARAA